jgi:hypothetical protein
MRILREDTINPYWLLAVVTFITRVPRNSKANLWRFIERGEPNRRIEALFIDRQNRSLGWVAIDESLVPHLHETRRTQAIALYTLKIESEGSALAH